jgi:hypothetical protein
MTSDSTLDLRTLLPQLLPRAIAWAHRHAQIIAKVGDPLTKAQIQIARQVGVRRPEEIRVLRVAHIPLPEEPALRLAAVETGLLGPDTLGLTLDHGIYAVRGQDSPRLIAHECRHVRQYEVLGSIENFLIIYLQQLAEFGYQDAPLEIDARAHEQAIA